jgi:biotin synthase-like enzyme
LVNPPWTSASDPALWGVRGGSRWPHFQRRAAPGELPRYVPFPFFLASAASVAASNGHEVLPLDSVASNLSAEDTIARVKDFAPELVFAEVSAPSLANDMAFLRALRDAVPGVKTACGGTFPAKEASRVMMANGFPDFWIAGEYDNAVSALASAAVGKMPFSEVPGLLLWGNPGTDIRLASVDDLDSLPQPPYSMLPMQNYSDPVCGLPSPGAQTWISRGCPFKCSFCVWPQVIYGGRKHRTRSIDKALDEVETLINQYGSESFYFDDDTTNIGERRMLELAEKIKARGLAKYPWSMMARADCMSPLMIEKLAGAGLYSIKYGVESISPMLINACEKGSNPVRMMSAIRKTKEAGVKIHLTFTFGIPGETLDTIRETMDFALDTAPESAQFSVCVPFPGTEFHSECARKGWLITEDWTRYLGGGEDFVVETPSLSAENLKKGFNEAVGRWRKFTAARTMRRKAALAEKIARRASAGQKWTCYGETEFADFIFKSAHSEEILSAMSETPEGCDFCVVASCHDEEKIFRQLLRDGLFKRENILKFYND